MKKFGGRLISCCKDASEDLKDGFPEQAHRRQSRSGSLGGLLDSKVACPIIIGDPELISQPKAGETPLLGSHAMAAQEMPSESEVEVGLFPLQQQHVSV